MGRVSAAEQRARAVLDRLPDGPVVGAEVGVFDGRMSRHLLTRPDLTLYMVDRWDAPTDSYAASGDPRATEDMEAAMHAAVMGTFDHASRRYIVQADSAFAARKVRDCELRLDFAFIDADHSAKGVADDIEAWLPALKAGGLLCGHDYGHPDYPGVKGMVDYYAHHCSWDLDLGADRTWFVRL